MSRLKETATGITASLTLAAALVLFSALPSVVLAAPAGYLIVTHDDFYHSVLPLEAAKQAAGFETLLVKTSEIGTPPTAQEIAAWIRSEYQAAPNLKYVLLVGDSEFIPTFYTSPCSSCDSTYDPIATDLYYATVDSEDYLPDVSVGRLPVATVAEADTVVQKILAYSSGASADTLLFGAFPEADYADRDLPLLESLGYSVATVFTGAYTGCNDKPTTSAIIDEINQGKLVTAYYGHGTVLGSGALCSMHVDQLENTVLPVMLSGGCETAQFDNPTYRSVGEELLIAPHGGAIAYIGGTAGGGYGYGYRYIVGFFNGLDSSGVLGEMHVQGLLEAYTAAYTAGADVGFDSWTQNFFEQINLLGDPSLVVQDLGVTDVDGDGYPSDEDCDDSDPMSFPGGSELCADLADNDCDGLVDCDDADCADWCPAPSGCIDLDRAACSADPTCAWSGKEKLCLDYAPPVSSCGVYDTQDECEQNACTWQSSKGRCR